MLVPALTSWWGDCVAEHLPLGMERDSEWLGWLGSVGLEPDVLEWEVRRLSNGEQQRLGILRALAMRPRVLLLDEPTAHLDPEQTENLEQLICRYVRSHEAASLMVSHDLPQLERMQCRHYVMKDGRLIRGEAA